MFGLWSTRKKSNNQSDDVQDENVIATLLVKVRSERKDLEHLMQGVLEIDVNVDIS